jgi:hypothetical protein
MAVTKMHALCGLLVLVADALLTVPAFGDEPGREKESETYALPLGLSYLALPALAGGAAAAFPDANEDQGAAIVAGVVVLGLAAPVSVHLVHSEPTRALVSPLGAAGSTLVLGLVGLGVGMLIADANCGSKNTESSSSCRLGPILVPTYAGAVLGYLGWALYDTGFNSSVEAPNSRKVSLVPTVSSGRAGMAIFGSF